jgi:hypothetical protein
MEVLDLAMDVIQELEHLKKLAEVDSTRASRFRQDYAGKPDAATSCPSGLEGAGERRASVMG